MVKAIKFFDCFAGIGGFRSGLEKAGGFECVGYCEIDKYAAAAYKAIYDTKGEDFYSDVTKIDTGNLRDFDLFVQNPFIFTSPYDKINYRKLYYIGVMIICQIRLFWVESCQKMVYNVVMRWCRFKQLNKF